MDTPHGREIQGFIDELNELRRRAGSPSLGELVRLSDRAFTKSTLSGHLSGHRAKLPSWRLVFAYVKACQASARSTGRNCERLGTIEQWRARWDATAKGEEAKSLFAESAVLDPTEPVGELETDESSSLAHNQSGSANDASIGPVFQLFRDDFRRLQKSLSIYDGLLIVISGPKFGAYFRINHNITTLGRDPGCDIWLNEPTVSRKHAEIACHGDQFTIHDLKSTNGTFCRGRRVENSLLTTNDELRVGPFKLLFAQGENDTARLRFQSYSNVRSNLIRASIEDTVDFGAQR